MKNFKTYVGKKIKTKSGEVVRIKKLLNVEGPLNYNLCPSYWVFIATYETEDNEKIFLYYWPFHFEKKEWETEKEKKEREEYEAWLKH